MKMKYFLRGLGVGVLLATLLLCISYRGQNSENSIIKQAKELGMQFPEKTPDTLIQPSATPSQASTGQAVSVQSKKPAQTKTPAPSAAQKATKEPEETQKPTQKPSGKTRFFTVRSGLLSSSVSRELKRAGFIKNADKFDRYLEKSGLAKKLIAGDYKIPVGASQEEVARIITGGK